ncbi:MAG: ATP-binding protein [Bacteroidota bacterium]
MLIGREQEQLTFEKLLQSSQAEFVVIYGRRRVGKTYLVREYFQEKIIFDFTGSYDTETSIQLNNFYVELKRVWTAATNVKSPQNWSEAFYLLTDYLLSLDNTTEKHIVFIDELPWLDRTRAGFVPALSYFWNQHASRMKNLILITCGSAASWILKKLLNDKGGLHNRVTRRIELRPFSLKEVADFCAFKRLKFTPYQMVQLYMILGGVPFYWQAIEQGKSVPQVIDQLCFAQNGLLAVEFKPLFQSLFKNAENHIQLIETLAKSPYGLTRQQLLKDSHVPKGGTFVRTIEQLIDCGFVKALSPFGKKSKNTVFRIIDFYSIFYLKFIRGNVTDRRNVWQNLANSPTYYSWMGYAFENICLTHLQAIHQALGISGIYTSVSSFYFKGNDLLPGAQIDLLIDRSDGIINLCEAKFTNKEFVLSKEYMANLRRKRTIFQEVTKTKKAVTTTLLTSYQAIQNAYYLEEIHSEVSLEDFFR